MKKAKTKKLSFKKILLAYGFHIWFLIFLINIVIFYTTQYYARSQTCLTTTQVQADSRCLYILSNKVYEKGSRTSPHKGHSCGTDITSVIPAFHTDTPATYLEPTYVGDICTAAPTVAPTVAPTIAPTTQPAEPTVAPTSPQTLVPSPNCLGGCLTQAPSAAPSNTLDPILNPDNPNDINIPDDQENGGGDFFSLLLNLLKALLELFIKLLGGN